MSPITLFEEPNFGGRSRVLDIGQRRFFTPDDFNDVASSIQVPEPQPGWASVQVSGAPPIAFRH